MTPTATTSYGALQGTTDGTTLSFRGIPFAKPPLGELRWRAPEPPAAWSGVRDATQFGPVAMQPKPIGPNTLGMPTDNYSEDCLSLNVWTPSLDGRRPVMVWVHGGAFVAGLGSQALYNGAQLASRGDVVVVTINYRMGVLGFLRSEALGSTGNEGILDQIAALRWVRDEIASFGGDPGNVTVFGESAGSISIAALLAAPAAKGLFRRAIMQSGSANPIREIAAAEAATGTVLKAAGLEAGQEDRLREVTAEQLIDAQVKAGPMLGLVGPVWEPSVLPRSTFELAAEGAYADTPILIGTMADENRLFMMADPDAMRLDFDGLVARCEGLAPGKGRAIAETYRDACAGRGDPGNPPDLWFAAQTDSFFRAPSMRLASLASRHGTVFAYLMTQKSPAANGILGACHALDLPFVFGLGNDPGMTNFAGEGPDLDRLSLAMQDAWLAFARTESPSHERLPWEPYDEATRATMIFDAAACRVENAPREAERALWG